MVEKNLYSSVNYQVEPEMVAGRTNLHRTKCIYDSTGFWCSRKLPLLKSPLAGAENPKFLILWLNHIQFTNSLNAVDELGFFMTSSKDVLATTVHNLESFLYC